MSEIGLIEGDVCNRDGCTGVMEPRETDTCCSCHINAPCSHCVDSIYECSECGEEVEPPELTYAAPSTPFILPKRKSDFERFNDLKDGEFGYVTICGKYYWMEYWGKYPSSMTTSEIVSKFNTCFGHKWIKHPRDGMFHIKVYTD